MELFDTLYLRYEKRTPYNRESIPTVLERGYIKNIFNIMCGSVFAQLTQRERDVILLTFGTGQELPQVEIANKLGIKQPNVSQYLNSALEKLDDYFIIILKSALCGIRYGKKEITLF